MLNAIVEEQIRSRPYWCLSRQRSWGVPVPVFYEKDSGKPVINEEIIKHLSELIRREGPDVWWNYSEEKLLPQQFLKERKEKNQELPVKGKDTLDVWFDSGASWYCAMNGNRSDVYIEGLDQINGWFQSSLLTSVGLTGQAPYKQLILHSFALDEKMRKMSKSMGNVIDPEVVTNGGRNLSKDPAWGVNVLRWWAASSFNNSLHAITIGDMKLRECENNISKILATIWFVLGNLNDFDPLTDEISVLQNLRLSDKLLLHHFYLYFENMVEKYDNYDYVGATVRITEFFINVLNTKYIGRFSRILQCDLVDSDERRSVQSALFKMLPYLLYSIAPILPSIAEEAAINSPIKDFRIFSYDRKISKFQVPTMWYQPILAEEMEKLKKISFNLKKLIEEKGENYTADFEKPCPSVLHSENLKMIQVHIKHSPNLTKILGKLQKSQNSDSFSELSYYLGVSSVSLECVEGMEEDFTLEFGRTSNTICIRCWDYTVTDQHELCPLCKKAVDHFDKHENVNRNKG